MGRTGGHDGTAPTLSVDSCGFCERLTKERMVVKKQPAFDGIRQQRTTPKAPIECKKNGPKNDIHISKLLSTKFGNCSQID